MKTTYLNYIYLNYKELLKKYTLLKIDSDVRIDHLSIASLRPYTLEYISNIKKYNSLTSGNYPMWILANLEAMGKSKSAERVYVYMLSKGWIEGL